MDSPGPRPPRKLAKKLLCIAIALALTGCATGRGFGKTYQPIVDMKGEDLGRYNANLAECQQYAQGISAGKTAAAGAITGAVLGAALAASFGLRGDSIGKVAGWGAASWGGAAAGAANVKQQDIIMRCLQGRGYRVLG